MLPASNRGVGMNLCFPDVCLTPPMGVPVPYVNLALNAMAVPFAFKTFFSCVNALNMGSTVPLTNGDPAGSMSPFMGMGKTTMGNPKIFIEALPGSNLLCPATGNNFIAALGAVLIPSITNVFFTYNGPSALADLAAALSPPREGEEEMVLPGGLGYLAIPVISIGLSSRVYGVIQRFTEKGMRALVLDLRGCPGGDLMAAIDVASLFLPEGAIIAAVVDGDGDETVYRSRTERPCATPLLILVDHKTASAAEVLAGSLGANDRAVILGESTFGKGTVQKVLAGVDEPFARYPNVATVLLPGGAPIEGSGVAPDVVV